MTKIKKGIGLYRHMLTDENFAFARQCGCTHLIIHLANYYKDQIVTATDDKHNYGDASGNDPIWSVKNLTHIREKAKRYGLEIYGIENFDPGDWYDVLLGGENRDAQIETLKQLIRNVGAAGIHTIGYNFSLAGVWGHSKNRAARGGAVSTCFDASKIPLHAPIPNGEIWNMRYVEGNGSFLEPVSSETLWDRLEYFFKKVIPVAEEAGVVLALHPDDPPMEGLRGQPRLVYQPELYQKVLDLYPSESNQLEFCMGSIQEMEHGDVYESIRRYGKQKKIRYCHFRNVKGKVPKYDEVFVDEGDIDMLRALRELDEIGFDGVIIPDHTPELDCQAPWHSGMAFALGYMSAAMAQLKENEKTS